MRLSDALQQLESTSAVGESPALEYLREGGFSSLGLLSSSSPQMLVFIEDKKYVDDLRKNPNISCVICSNELLEELPDELGVAVAQSPRHAFFTLHNALASGTFYWTSFPSEIGVSARVHARAFVADKDVRIGEGCVIEPNATVLERSILEDGVVVRAGAVVGSEGFQFTSSDGALRSVVHAGGVRLGRGVEIQSNTCIDRAIFGGYTEIGEGTKVDNLVHIAHNAWIGRNCHVVAGAMIAGSVRIGDGVWIGPMASVSHEVRVGDGATVTMGAVVTRDVRPHQRVTGNFAIDHAKFIAFMRSVR